MESTQIITKFSTKLIKTSKKAVLSNFDLILKISIFESHVKKYPKRMFTSVRFQGTLGNKCPDVIQMYVVNTQVGFVFHPANFKAEGWAWIEYHTVSDDTTGRRCKDSLSWFGAVDGRCYSHRYF